MKGDTEFFESKRSRKVEKGRERSRKVEEGRGRSRNIRKVEEYEKG
jgi:hypothetical protein